MCSTPAGRKKPRASHARMSAIFHVHGSSGICVSPPMLSSRENGSSHLRARHGKRRFTRAHAKRGVLQRRQPRHLRPPAHAELAGEPQQPPAHPPSVKVHKRNL